MHCDIFNRYLYKQIKIKYDVERKRYIIYYLKAV